MAIMSESKGQAEELFKRQGGQNVTVRCGGCGKGVQA